MEKFSCWAILEIMGHQKFAGLVTEQQLAGAGMIRIDIPAVDTTPEQTRIFGPSALYCLIPVTEEVARAVAETLAVKPIAVYDLPKEWQTKIRQPALPLRDFADEDEDEERHY